MGGLWFWHPDLPRVDATWVNAIAAVAAAVAAFAAFSAARKAADSSRELAQIERDRWHAELTPEFEISVQPALGLSLSLRVVLVGPAFLDHLDEVVISIRDDQHRVEALEEVREPTTKEQSEDRVFGPEHFIRHVPQSRACPTGKLVGRTGDPFRALLGDEQQLTLAPTSAPSWWSNLSRDRWDKVYRRRPIKLTLRCTLAGHSPWIVQHEIPWEEFVDHRVAPASHTVDEKSRG